MRERYCGFPNNNNSHFDTEAISRIIIDMKRGKAADIVRLTVEHMQHSIQFNLFPDSHSVVSVLLSKFFRLKLFIYADPHLTAPTSKIFYVLEKENSCKNTAL